jgi:hypothetical protein
VRTTARRALAASAASAAPALERGPLDELDFSSFALLAARLRALAFYAVTVLLSLPLVVSMLLITPFQLAFDKHRRAALHFVNDLWAVCSTSLFYPVEVRGLENLPAYDEPAVLVANHQSYLDIYSLFHLRRPFKVPLQPATRDRAAADSPSRSSSPRRATSSSPSSAGACILPVTCPSSGWTSAARWSA